MFIVPICILLQDPVSECIKRNTQELEELQKEQNKKLEKSPTLVSDEPRAMHDSKSGVRPGLLPLVSSSQADTRHPSDTLDRVAILTFVGGISDRSHTGSFRPRPRVRA